MFTWICPKCGREVPPSYSECPNCAANQQPAAAAAREETAAAPPAAHAVPRPPARSKPRSSAVAVPWWFLIALLTVAFLGVGFAVVSWQQQRHARTDAQIAAPLQPPPAGPPAVQANPAFRDLELTALRLTEDAKQKAFVQFVVVNHSAADLGEIGGTVHLKAVAKPQDQEAVGTFSFKATLGPYESKELKEPLDTKLRVYELPDWQFLKADIAAKQ